MHPSNIPDFTVMFDIILYHPEIPSNTGNIIRLCANTGATLHLVKPLGFSLEDRLLRRAGLDYHECATIIVHESWEECRDRFRGRRVFAVSTKATQRYDLNQYLKAGAFLFGPEGSGLPSDLMETMSDHQRIRVPMIPGSRSL
ncbi:MAG TPA: tRNA (cytidine(34)-2'-O)-methyltransferase, partial [Nitrospiraceae bacterium]